MSPSKNPAIPVSGNASPAAAHVTAKVIKAEIKSIDPNTHRLVLSSGETLELSKSIDAKNFKAGQKVSVSCEMAAGKMTATRLEAAKPH